MYILQTTFECLLETSSPKVGAVREQQRENQPTKNEDIYFYCIVPKGKRYKDRDWGGQKDMEGNCGIS
jgi:hypothetical protein